MAKPILRDNPSHKRNKPQTPRNDYAPGWVYAMWDDREKLLKIGLSRCPEKRCYYLSKQYGQLQFVAKFFTFNMALVESNAHKAFALKRVYRDKNLNGFTEWFSNVNCLMVWLCLLKHSMLVNLYYIGAAILGFAILSAIVIR